MRLLQLIRFTFVHFICWTSAISWWKSVSAFRSKSVIRTFKGYILAQIIGLSLIWNMNLSLNTEPKSRHWLYNCLWESEFFLLGLVIINHGNVSLAFLKATVLMICPSVSRGSVFWRWAGHISVLGVSGLCKGWKWRTEFWTEGDAPARGSLIEETVESSLEWRERIAGLRVAGGPGREGCRTGS